jgi:hypothetical protein
MAGIKVLDYATDRQARAKALVAAAQAAMTEAQTKLADANHGHDQAATDITNLAQEMTDLRRQLQNIAVPADAQPLIDQLTADMTTMRGKQEALLDADEELFYRQRGIARAQAQLAAASAILNSANAGLTAATADEASRQALRDAVAKAPLTTMKADAAAAMAGATYTSAQNKLNGQDIPAELFTRSIQRGGEAAAAVEQTRTEAQWAENVMNEDLNSTQGQAGTVAGARTTFMRSQDALHMYVLTAKQRFDQAVSVLAAIPNGPTPSPTEQAKISDATKKADRDTALTNEEDLAAAQAVYDSAQASVDKATWEAIRTDADADPSTDPGVQAAVALRDGTILANLNQAKTAFTAAMQGTLDEWQTDVPDATWGLVSSFQVAQAILTDLSNIDPTALQTQMDTDEHPYAQALSDQAKNERATLLLANAVHDRADWRDAVSRNESATTASAVRGSA